MLIYMRTTLVIDDELLRQAKRRAADRGVTVSDIVNDAIRELVREPVRPSVPFTMVTYGRPGRRVAHEPVDFAAALEREERNQPPR